MRKAEIVQRIVQELGCTTAKADAALEGVLEAVKAALQQGESVILRGMGSFRVHATHARMGRNPKTGAEATIPARRVVRFTAGLLFKQALAGVVHPRRGTSQD